MVTTKFGPHSAVLLHLLVEEALDIPVVWIDTGFNTRATLEFAEELTQQLGLNLKVFRPLAVWQGFVPDLDDPAHGAFSEQVKLEPFARALDALAPDAWFSSLRQSQTQHRSAHQHFNTSHASYVKVCPLLHWTDDDMDTYLHGNDLASEHDYHDPTKGGPRRECGLHVNY